MKTQTILLLLLLIVGAAGCSGMSQTPNFPNEVPKEAGLSEGSSGRGILGTWQISVNPATLAAAVLPVRLTQNHYNVTDLVLPPLCTNCLRIDVKGLNPVTHIMDVDITLKNLYLKDVYDVRGIVQMSSAGFKLTNSDDWTKLWDYPGGDTINPFLAYAKDVDLREFTINATHTRKALIWLPDPLNIPLIMFTIDASWQDNCLEPYTIDNFVQNGVLQSTVGSQVELFVNVYDWQNNANKVTLVATAITGESFTQFAKYSGNTWRMILGNKMGAPAGDYKVRVIATASDSATVALYDYFTVTIIP